MAAMAALRTLQIYGTGSATANAVAQVTVPSASVLRGVLASLAVQSITAASQTIVELSKVATAQIGTNGALDPFCELRFFSNFVTSGLDNGAQNVFIPLHVPCRQGELIYLHANVSGTCTYYFNGILIY